MKKVIVSRGFHNTNILFERRNEKSVAVRWQVFTNGIEYKYNIGTMDFEDKASDRQIEVYSTNFINSMDCYDAVANVCHQLRNSKDIIEKDFLNSFSKKFLKSKVH